MENKKVDTSPVLVRALGGLGEVGKNTYCIENDSTTILIDAGVLFADPSLPGINYIIPDYKHLKEAGNKFKAIFITHGHEDHIGGIPFLLQRVHVPVIYAPKLAKALIEHKLAELKNKPKVEIKEFDENSEIIIDDFKFNFFHVTHSIPDSYAIRITTPNGVILHSGDFKVDLTPVDHDIDLTRMSDYGKQGVDLLLADSTNAEKEGYTPSEKSVITSLNEVFRQAEGRIIISTFSSNISRIQQILETAVKYKRKIAIFGRSMESNIQAARQYGYIKIPDASFISNPDLIKKMNPNEVLILCTGSQGEPLAALSRIAFNIHRQIKINFGDTVIFSSSPIPGNTYAINKVINQLTRDGAIVLVNSSTNKLHASGHPCKQELRLIQKIIKPKYFMPVHGEYHMLKLHAQIAIECGMQEDHTFICANGDTVKLENGKCSYGERIYTDVEYLDSVESFGVSTATIKDRSLLSSNGLVSVSSLIENNKLAFKPTINTKGFSYFITADSTYIKDLQDILEKQINDALDKNHTQDEINTLIEVVSSKYFYKITRRNPVVVSQIVLNK